MPAAEPERSLPGLRSRQHDDTPPATERQPPPEPSDRRQPAGNRPSFCSPRHATAGDRAAEATALTDLGVTKLSEGDHAGAVASLESALAITRELGDRERETDIVGNLGLAMLGVGQAPRARQMFEHGLAYARAKRDHLGEKTAMERLGLAHWHLREFATAL